MALFPVYLSLIDMDLYAAASPRAAAYNALDDDTKSQWLVEITRFFNRQQWAGEPTETYPDDQDHQWPRDGVEGVTDGTTPQAILDGFAEMVIWAVRDASVLDQTSSGKNIKRVDAGKGVGVEFFSPSSTTAGRFPVAVQELVGQYLASAAVTGLGIPVTNGTCNESSFADSDDEYGLSGA